MRSFVRFTIVAYCIEAILVAPLVFFPGAGHSPFWYTQIPVLVVVGLIEPTAGTCFQWRACRVRCRHARATFADPRCRRTAECALPRPIVTTC
jgi:hypothetical protein